MQVQVEEKSPAFLRTVFPMIVEKCKLRWNGATGVKKEVKAFFNTFQGRPQVTFKYGTRYYRFDVELATLEEMAYNKRENFK